MGDAGKAGVVDRMSYGQEYLADNAYEIEQEQKRWESICIIAEIEASKGIWRTKDGRVLKVEEMDTGHIENCIRMLERNNVPFRKPYIKMFTDELCRR